MATERDKPQQEGLSNEGFGQAPEGTYDMLKDLLEGKKVRIWGTFRHKTWMHVSIEPVCAETGGSCMNLLIQQRTIAHQDRIGFHAHITDKDNVVRLSAGSLSKDAKHDVEKPTPELETMLDILKEFQGRLPTTMWE